MKQGLQFRNSPINFFVRLHSPSRNYDDMRTEYMNDAINLTKEVGRVNLSFSTGVDSQIALRAFLDANIEPNVYYLRYVGYENEEYIRVKECEDFYNIRINVIDLHLDDLQHEFITRNTNNKLESMRQVPFEYLSKLIPNQYPLVSIGPHDMGQQFFGATTERANIYWNYFQGELQRFRMMNKYRKIFDFPYSPEALATTYTDEVIKTFSRTVRYYRETASFVPVYDFWKIFIKPMLYGKHYKNDIIWYGKLTGQENLPKWFYDRTTRYITESAITANYWELVNFIENNRQGYIDFTENTYVKNHTSFISLYSCDLDLSVYNNLNGFENFT